MDIGDDAPRGQDVLVVGGGPHRVEAGHVPLEVTSDRVGLGGVVVVERTAADSGHLGWSSIVTCANPRRAQFEVYLLNAPAGTAATEVSRSS